MFEGDYYDRLRVDVRALEDGTALEAHAYVIRDAYAHILSREPWDPGRFEREQKGAFLRTYTGFEWLDSSEAGSSEKSPR